MGDDVGTWYEWVGRRRRRSRVGPWTTDQTSRTTVVTTVGTLTGSPDFQPGGDDDGDDCGIRVEGPRTLVWKGRVVTLTDVDSFGGPPCSYTDGPGR